MMTGKFRALRATIILGALPLLAHAGEIRRITAFDNNATVAFVYNHLGYGERLNPPNGPYFDTEQGFMKGGRLALSGMGRGHMYVELSYQMTNGSVTYNGGIQHANGTTTPVTTSLYDHIVDYGLRVGQGFAVTSWSLLVPYIGYGARHWQRQADNESYHNQRLAAGVLWQVMPTRHFLASLDLAYGRVVQPRITVPGLFQEGLGPKPWERAGVSFNYFIAHSETVFASATFTRFQYGAGAQTSQGHEPFSQTESIDYDLGARFLF